MRARAYFEAVCGNTVGAGAGGCSLERSNFEAVFAFLVASGHWIWVIDGLSCAGAAFATLPVRAGTEVTESHDDSQGGVQCTARLVRLPSLTKTHAVTLTETV